MKKRILSTFFIFALFFVTPFQANAGCDAGGPGATSCSLTSETEILGNTVKETATVTCGNGYYACCNYEPLGTSITAKCKSTRATITQAPGN